MIFERVGYKKSRFQPSGWYQRKHALPGASKCHSFGGRGPCLRCLRVGPSCRQYRRDPDWIPAGYRRDPDGIPAGSLRDPGGIPAVSRWDPGGIPAESRRDPGGILARSWRDPGGIPMGSRRDTGGIPTGYRPACLLARPRSCLACLACCSSCCFSSSLELGGLGFDL